ncbi:hypothetical protein QAD02_020835 [Eretmocerus hayati]|uniref:Uncharacterized protein n=1 Tax=Eretmocerus hayati TaxID=131215 RepID=A0ACC2PNP6_9HYME|nr:hypothetical protein QAD02_020835 [Eretmocerus hayati]
MDDEEEVIFMDVRLTYRGLDGFLEKHQELSKKPIFIILRGCSPEEARKITISQISKQAKKVEINHVKELTGAEQAQNVFQVLHDLGMKGQHRAHYWRDKPIPGSFRELFELATCRLDTEIKHPGINTPYLYIGGPRSITCLHFEDGLFLSLNWLLWGIFPSPKQLDEWGIKVIYATQYEKDAALIGIVWHAASNQGLYCAVAKNYASQSCKDDEEIPLCDCSEEITQRTPWHIFTSRDVPLKNITPNLELAHNSGPVVPATEVIVPQNVEEPTNKISPDTLNDDDRVAVNNSSGQREGVYPCKSCEKVFTNHKARWAHQERAHAATVECPKKTVPTSFRRWRDGGIISSIIKKYKKKNAAYVVES